MPGAIAIAPLHACTWPFDVWTSPMLFPSLANAISAGRVSVIVSDVRVAFPKFVTTNVYATGPAATGAAGVRLMTIPTAGAAFTANGAEVTGPVVTAAALLASTPEAVAV